MNRIILAREKQRGRGEYYETDDRVCCASIDGFESAYEINPEAPLGSGGNAIVYGCKDIGGGESFAIKIQIETQSCVFHVAFL